MSPMKDRQFDSWATASKSAPPAPPPAKEINPAAVRAMADVGVDISARWRRAIYGAESSASDWAI